MGILAIDLETTGIDPVGGHILEVAFAVADRLADIDPSAVESFVIDQEDVLLNPFVARMHTASGLIDDLLDPHGRRWKLEEVEALIVERLREFGARGHILAGNSVHFDHAWISVHMPALDQILSHRHIDATSDWLLDLEAGQPSAKVSTGTAHRAQHDIASSIIQLQAAIARRRTVQDDRSQ